MTGQVLGGAKATGNADYRIKLALPLASLSKTTVQGSVTLGGNELQISEQTPKLINARGVVGFTEHGFR